MNEQNPHNLEQARGQYQKVWKSDLKTTSDNNRIERLQINTKNQKNLGKKE